MSFGLFWIRVDLKLLYFSLAFSKFSSILLLAPRVVAVTTADRRPNLAPSNASNSNTVGSNLFGVYDSPTMLPRTPLAPGNIF